MKALALLVALFGLAASLGVQTSPAPGTVPAVAIPEVRAAETYAEATVKADPASVQALIGSDDGDPDAPWACASCHGAMGQGSLDVPRLAGLAARLSHRAIARLPQRHAPRRQHAICRLDP